MKYTSVSCLLLGMAVALHPVVLNSQSQPAISNPVPFIGQPLAPARATPRRAWSYYDHQRSWLRFRFTGAMERASSGYHFCERRERECGSSRIQHGTSWHGGRDGCESRAGWWIVQLGVL